LNKDEIEKEFEKIKQKDFLQHGLIVHQKFCSELVKHIRKSPIVDGRHYNIKGNKEIKNLQIALECLEEIFPQLKKDD
jgi:dTDP-D-glucose 4,6-dehydratase